MYQTLYLEVLHVCVNIKELSHTFSNFCIIKSLFFSYMEKNPLKLWKQSSYKVVISMSVLLPAVSLLCGKITALSADGGL